MIEFNILLYSLYGSSVSLYDRFIILRMIYSYNFEFIVHYFVWLQCLALFT